MRTQRLRTLLHLGIALTLGIVAAAVAYYWPASPRARLQCEHIAWVMAFSPDSRQLAVLDRDAGIDVTGQILVWDVASGALLHRLDNGVKEYPSKIAFAPDGKSLGVVDVGAVTRFDLATGRLVAHHEHPAWPRDPDQYLGRELLFSPTGQWLYHDVHAGRIFDVETGDVVHDYHERWPDRFHGAHGGCVAVLVGEDVKTFDALTGAAVGSFSPAVTRAMLPFSSAWFAADGTHGLYFDRRKRWVLHNGVHGSEFEVMRDWESMWGESMSADHRYLAMSVSRSGAVRAFMSLFRTHQATLYVIDTTTGTEVCTPIRDAVRSCFAPDGKTLAVSDADKCIELWDWPPSSSRWPWAAIVGAAVLLASGYLIWWRRARHGATRQRIEVSGAARPVPGGTP